MSHQSDLISEDILAYLSRTVTAQRACLSVITPTREEN